jgi:hypothetical protein
MLCVTAYCRSCLECALVYQWMNHVSSLVSLVWCAALMRLMLLCNFRRAGSCLRRSCSEGLHTIMYSEVVTERQKAFPYRGGVEQAQLTRTCSFSMESWRSEPPIWFANVMWWSGCHVADIVVADVSVFRLLILIVMRHSLLRLVSSDGDISHGKFIFIWIANMLACCYMTHFWHYIFKSIFYFLVILTYGNQIGLYTSSIYMDNLEIPVDYWLPLYIAHLVNLDEDYGFLLVLRLFSKRQGWVIWE